MFRSRLNYTVPMNLPRSANFQRVLKKKPYCLFITLCSVYLTNPAPNSAPPGCWESQRRIGHSWGQQKCFPSMEHSQSTYRLIRTKLQTQGEANPKIQFFFLLWVLFLSFPWVFSATKQAKNTEKKPVLEWNLSQRIWKCTLTSSWSKEQKKKRKARLQYPKFCSFAKLRKERNRERERGSWPMFRRTREEESKSFAIAMKL